MSDRSDPIAEIHLLAACMESKTARIEARKFITGRDFLQPHHEDIWDAMSRLDRHDKHVDAATLAATLGKKAMPLIAEIMTTHGFPDHVADYAGIIRSWSTKRQVEAVARRVLQEVDNPELNASGFAANVVSRFAAIRDSGMGADDITALTVSELLDQADDEPDWLIPGLLERRDRLMLTGEEGLGKSHLLRQIAILGAAGLDPFSPGTTLEPLRSLVIDCENTWSQVRRKVRPAVEWATRWGHDPAERMMVDCTSRMDITRDKDISRIHQLLDAWQPDLVVIGPLYRLVPRALQNDDDTAPVLAALDTIRDRGCALLMEAHAGHAIGKGGVRDLRPRGSSSLLGWPEFGFGMRGIGTEGYCDLVPWRGQREERVWPQRMRKADGYRWLPNDNLYAYNGAAS
jgi:replicative DNA helicase